MDEHEMMAFEYETELGRLLTWKSLSYARIHYLKIKIERHRKLSRTYRPPLCGLIKEKT